MKKSETRHITIAIKALTGVYDADTDNVYAEHCSRECPYIARVPFSGTMGCQLFESVLHNDDQRGELRRLNVCMNAEGMD